MDILATCRREKPHMNIKEYMKRAIRDPECELECVYGDNPRNGRLTKMQFLHVLNNLRQTYKGKAETNTLDIQLHYSKLGTVWSAAHERWENVKKGTGISSIRCTIEGIESIKRYCKTNSIDGLPNVTFMRKEIYADPKFESLEFSSIKNTDYNFRINLKKEIPLQATSEEASAMQEKLPSASKYYRYKKRFSFFTEDGLFRIDLTAIKQNLYNRKTQSYNVYKDLLSSKILKQNETFEIEIEYIGSSSIDDTCAIDVFAKQYHVPAFDEEDDKVYAEQLKITSQDLLHPSIDLVIGTNDTELPAWPEWSGETTTTSAEQQQVNITPYAKASSLKGAYHSQGRNVKDKDKKWAGHLDHVLLSYWFSCDRNPLYLAILEFEKALIFENVLVNHTASYDDAPKHANYVKYIIQPPFTEEEIVKIQEVYPFEKKIASLPEVIEVPFSEIDELQEYEESYASSPTGQPVPPAQYAFFEPEATDTQGLSVDEGGETQGDPGDSFEPQPEKEPDSQGGGGDQQHAPAWAPKVNLEKTNELKQLRSNFQIIDRVIALFNSIIGQILMLVSTGEILVSRRKRWEILEEYKTLTEQTKGKVQFLGPQPVSMSLNELNVDNPHSILQGYVVTEKADGIRAELFIDKYGVGYLITQKLEIIHTGLQFIDTLARKAPPPPLAGQWILDGEYITQNKDGRPINLFMIFDIYYADNGEYPVHPFTLPWIHPDKDMPCRSSILHDFKRRVQTTSAKNGSRHSGYLNISSQDTIEQSHCMRVEFKVYYEGPKALKTDKKDSTKFTNLGGIGKVSKKIWSKRQKAYEYYIDGLIYLPMYLSVNSSHPEETKNTIGREWPQNYKWKPPEENTIDFKLRYVKDYHNGRAVEKITSVTLNGKVQRCKQVKLYVGYDIRKDDESDFAMKILTEKAWRGFNDILFDPPGEKRSVHICNIPLTRNKILCEKDKTEVVDGLIYEMKYVPDAADGMHFRPLRVRSDKRSPNERRTANSVWSTIQNPVTESLITGKEYLHTLKGVSEETLAQYAYYLDDPNEMAEDTPLRDLHNYIKSKLISIACSIITTKSISILDTSIGRGGDIGKYLRCNKPISLLLGLDISPDINKAAKRFYMDKNDAKAMFIQYDTSVRIRDGEGCVGEHKERNQSLIDILYDSKKKMPDDLKSVVPKYRGLALRGFDVISSQFSIHYYFKDELTLRSYIQNISDNCKEGGYFIGTCYDGMRVFDLLEQSEQGRIEMKDNFDQRVYSIAKKYSIDNFTYEEINKEELFGQKIEVYMRSIGQTIIEYLVNFDMFIDIMKEYNFHLVRPGNKKSSSARNILNSKDISTADGLGSFDRIIEALPKLQSSDRDLKKFYGGALRMSIQKNQPLRVLSSLNNWFIFQRITKQKSKQGVTGEIDAEAAADEFGEYLTHGGVEESGW